MTDQELRAPREFLEDVLQIKHGDTAWESAWIEQIEAYIRDSQLAILDQVRMEEPKPVAPLSQDQLLAGGLVTHSKMIGAQMAIIGFNRKIDNLKAGIEKGEK